MLADQSESDIQDGEIIDKWRMEYAPGMNGELAPFTKEMMCVSYDKSIRMEDSSEQTLQHLVDGGSEEQMTFAAIASDRSRSRANGRAGNATVPTIIMRGPRMKCLEFEAHDVSFGAMNFAAIDMGGEVQLNLRTRRVLGSESNTEGNQCALKHVAMGLEWMENKHHVRIPSRSRVDLMASELRMGEYQNSAAFYGRVSKPSALM